jgi:hypothetical protein
VILVDEWKASDKFQQFFGDPALQELIASSGADATPSDIMTTQANASPDQF